MPWVKYSTPDKYPHIAHFVTAPAFKGKGYAREVLGYAEELLKEQFKTHIVTLGTAKEHPWLPKNVSNPLGLRRMIRFILEENSIQLYYSRKN